MSPEHIHVVVKVGGITFVKRGSANHLNAVCVCIYIRLEDAQENLSIALTHANRAVELDTRAVESDCADLDIVSDAISAYSKSISLINGVINDLNNGQEFSKGRANAQEEERRLKAIKQSYKDRILILSAIPGTVINAPKL
ncbi:hypothetical protein BJ165DRAFT_1158979 [Panaeolus papilionaceus]|nr:hypothetical protein BJ165DRAFT_1158979 [Panaeolus papilionaceus]